ncbi:MYCBP-associated protein [Synchiropus picturatus]
MLPRVQKTCLTDDARTHPRRPIQNSLVHNSPPNNYSGPTGFQFDKKGMVLPHSILGNVEDFKSYLEARGETELLKRMPISNTDASTTIPVIPLESPEEMPSDSRNTQSNALKHWSTAMRRRKKQAFSLSDQLKRPVEYLLMNQTNDYRDVQEQKEVLNQVMPLIHHGYGYHVGSEFWSLPQRFGDEMTGITSTLTLRDQGKREPVMFIGQSTNMRIESGNIYTECVRRATRTWTQSLYLQEKREEIAEVLHDFEFRKPDMSGLEVIGSNKPTVFVEVTRSPFLEEEKEKKEDSEIKEENIDHLSSFSDDRPVIPALRFCGQLASWTGNSPIHQGKVGINATIIFEAAARENAVSYVDLRNEGNTAIFFSWQQLLLPQSFSNLKPQTKSPHFFFDSASGVILPGSSEQIEFVFKSQSPGIKTEQWQLNTHPVLLQGAALQVTLRGVSLYHDSTVDERQLLEKNLEKSVTVNMCKSIMYDILMGIHTPERPSSPADLYITEEEDFLNKNPKLQYRDQPVEDLKKLWHEVNPTVTWDLSVDTLREGVLSLPEHGTYEWTITREKGLEKLNTLLIKLSEPLPRNNHLTAVEMGKHLWGILFDSLAAEAVWLKQLLGLPERNTWMQSETEQDTKKKDKKKKEDPKKGAKEKPEEQIVTDPEMIVIYKRLLRQKVYSMIEELVDNLCSLMDEREIIEDDFDIDFYV